MTKSKLPPLAVTFIFESPQWKKSAPDIRKWGKLALQTALKEEGTASSHTPHEGEAAGAESQTIRFRNSALLPAECAKFSISVVLADDAFLQQYNQQYRGKNKPTNILSFASEPSRHCEEAKLTKQSSLDRVANARDDELDHYLGDLMLAFETIEREAAEQQKSLQAHITHLLVHGLLHVLGYDHEADDEAEMMENKEISILSLLAIENPYKIM